MSSRNHSKFGGAELIGICTKESLSQENKRFQVHCTSCISKYTTLDNHRTKGGSDIKTIFKKESAIEIEYQNAFGELNDKYSDLRTIYKDGTRNEDKKKEQ